MTLDIRIPIEIIIKLPAQSSVATSHASGDLLDPSPPGETGSLCRSPPALDMAKKDLCKVCRGNFRGRSKKIKFEGGFCHKSCLPEKTGTFPNSLPTHLEALQDPAFAASKKFDLEHPRQFSTSLPPDEESSLRALPALICAAGDGKIPRHSPAIEFDGKTYHETCAPNYVVPVSPPRKPRKAKHKFKRKK